MFRKGGEYYLSLNPSAADGSECITCFELPLEKAIVYCAKMDIAEAEGKKMVRNPFTYPLDQLLVTFALARRNGAVIHSAGVDFHGRGFLFYLNGYCVVWTDLGA